MQKRRGGIMKRILCAVCLAMAVFWGLGQSAGEEVEDFLIIAPYGGEAFDPCADYSLIPSSGGEPFVVNEPAAVEQDFSEINAKWEEVRRSLKGASPDTIISYDGSTGEFTITECDPSNYDLTPIEPSMPDEVPSAGIPGP